MATQSAMRAASRRRPAITPVPPASVYTPPTPLPRRALIVRPAYPPAPAPPRLVPAPPPAQPAVFEFRLRPLVARAIAAQPTTRPQVLARAAATGSVVTRRPPAAVVVRSPGPQGTTARSRLLPMPAGHRPPAWLLRPVVANLAAVPRPVTWPRSQCPWNLQTHLPVFPYGPRFTIRDPGLTATLPLQGLTFTIRDPGRIAVLNN